MSISVTVYVSGARGFNMMYQKSPKSYLSVVILALTAFSLSACSSISEETCVGGNWETIGFEDGAKGKKASKTDKYAKRCAKYDAVVDLDSYMTGYEAGLPRYCTFENGYERGLDGSSYNSVCGGELAADYAPGYEEGRMVYRIYQEHNAMLSNYDRYGSALYDVRRRLREDELSDDERKRLNNKARRLKRDMYSLNRDIREFERRYDLPRSSLGRDLY